MNFKLKSYEKLNSEIKGTIMNSEIKGTIM